MENLTTVEVNRSCLGTLVSQDSLLYKTFFTTKPCFENGYLLLICDSLSMADEASVAIEASPIDCSRIVNVLQLQGIKVFVEVSETIISLGSTLETVNKDTIINTVNDEVYNEYLDEESAIAFMESLQTTDVPGKKLNPGLESELAKQIEESEKQSSLLLNCFLYFYFDCSNDYSKNFEPVFEPNQEKKSMSNAMLAEAINTASSDIASEMFPRTQAENDALNVSRIILSDLIPELARLYNIPEPEIQAMLLSVAVSPATISGLIADFGTARLKGKVLGAENSKTSNGLHTQSNSNSSHFSNNAANSVTHADALPVETEKPFSTTTAIPQETVTQNIANPTKSETQRLRDILKEKQMPLKYKQIESLPLRQTPKAKITSKNIENELTGMAIYVEDAVKSITSKLGTQVLILRSISELDDSQVKASADLRGIENPTPGQIYLASMLKVYKRWGSENKRPTYLQMAVTRVLEKLAHSIASADVSA